MDGAGSREGAEHRPDARRAGHLLTVHVGTSGWSYAHWTGVPYRPRLPLDYPRLAWFLACVPPGLAVAVELRHPSSHCDPVFELLERHGAAYCVMSGAGLPCVLRATARFVYVRLHGPDPHHLYAGSYADADLHWWAERIREWERSGRDVFAYFNNDGEGHAVRNAATLQRILRG